MSDDAVLAGLEWKREAGDETLPVREVWRQNMCRSLLLEESVAAQPVGLRHVL